jgi:hypothetical protein
MEQMFSYGSPPVSSNPFGYKPSTGVNLRPPSTYTIREGMKAHHLPSEDFICKMNVSFIKRATYSHFLRSLSSTFVANENCFSEKWAT